MHYNLDNQYPRATTTCVTRRLEISSRVVVDHLRTPLVVELLSTEPGPACTFVSLSLAGSFRGYDAMATLSGSICFRWKRYSIAVEFRSWSASVTELLLRPVGIRRLDHLSDRYFFEAHRVADVVANIVSLSGMQHSIVQPHEATMIASPGYEGVESHAEPERVAG